MGCPNIRKAFHVSLEPAYDLQEKRHISTRYSSNHVEGLQDVARDYLQITIMVPSILEKILGYRTFTIVFDAWLRYMASNV